MVAYSFKARFVSKIIDGTKRQTIRAERKRHARSGETLQLYTAMRTRYCRLIGRSICDSVTPIRLCFSATNPYIEIRQTEIRGTPLLDAFARSDGFDHGWDEMHHFWEINHDLELSPLFCGVLIRWRGLALVEGV